MTLTPFLILLAVLVIMIVGFYAAYRHASHQGPFRLSNYLWLATVPFLTLVPVWYVYGIGAVYFFVISIVAGMSMEHSIGVVLHKTLGRHLWRYYRCTVNGYTSLLVAPFWGMAGLLFFLLAKMFAL
ncbi:hypothetical protein L0Y34_02030 [Candidatus Parcubacteria bacterium]|nr:hypothetical protein [Candidatus Parcubacteria bacterium]